MTNRVAERAVLCPGCKLGHLHRNVKPDALGRIIERCDGTGCNYRRVVSGDEQVVVPLSGSMTSVRGGLPARSNHVVSRPALAPLNPNVSATLAPPVVGAPCQHCGQKVKPRRMCIQCRTRPCLPHKRRCTVCKPPTKRLPSRYCVECGEKYDRQRGDPPSAAYRCPKHRKDKAA